MESGLKREVLPKKNRNHGRVTKPSEVWLNIRVPVEVGDYIRNMARLNDRSLSYIARTLVIDEVCRFRNIPTTPLSDWLRFPEA